MLSSGEIIKRKETKKRLTEMSELLITNWNDVHARGNNFRSRLVHPEDDKLTSDELQAIETYAAVVTALNSFDR